MAAVAYSALPSRLMPTAETWAVPRAGCDVGCVAGAVAGCDVGAVAGTVSGCGAGRGTGAEDGGAAGAAGRVTGTLGAVAGETCGPARRGSEPLQPMTSTAT